MWPTHSKCLAAAALLTSHVSSTLAQQTCNGQASFCDRQYSNVSFIGTHDSAFVGNIMDPRVNQEVSLTDQLNAGIRFVQAQTHRSIGDSNVLEMCHTSCYLEDAGPLTTYLSTVKSWLDANADEVLTMLLVNGDNVDVSLFDAAFTTTGLKEYAFVPSTSPNTLAINAWPTLGELITSNKRLVMFLDAGAQEAQFPYILTEFNYFFETPYDATNVTSFQSCPLDRPPGASPQGRMYIVNHFLDDAIFSIDIPDNLDDYSTNNATGPGSIGQQNAACEAAYGRVPNFVLVDMFDRGDVFAAQNTMNGV